MRARAGGEPGFVHWVVAALLATGLAVGGVYFARWAIQKAEHKVKQLAENDLGLSSGWLLATPTATEYLHYEVRGSGVAGQFEESVLQSEASGRSVATTTYLVTGTLRASNLSTTFQLQAGNGGLGAKSTVAGTVEGGVLYLDLGSIGGPHRAAFLAGTSITYEEDVGKLHLSVSATGGL